MRLHAQKNDFPTYESIDSMKEMYSYNVWSYSCNSPLTHWIFATANMFPSFLLLSQIILSVTKIITLHQLQEKIGLFWRMEHESTLILIKSCKYFVVNLDLSCTSFTLSSYSYVRAVQLVPLYFLIPQLTLYGCTVYNVTFAFWFSRILSLILMLIRLYMLIFLHYFLTI